jgi:farnesyl-diphosphate farnesyltransferase
MPKHQAHLYTDLSHYSDLEFQTRLLHGVARSFALTIPQLPPALAPVVANAYLLCRITDTIEDETAITVQQKRVLAAQFTDVVAGHGDAQAFAEDFLPLLGPQRLPAERCLIRETRRVIDILRGFNPIQQRALARCVRIMAEGMVAFQADKSPHGLTDMPMFNRYCYHVAGVVGELLTELYCDYNPALAAHNDRDQLQALAVSFGQGLQMTNILKDIWEDLERGVCWLPQDVFTAAGYDLKRLAERHYQPAYGAGLERMLAIAHGHLRNALDYILLLPADKAGLRKFCLWAWGMALLTLRKIHKHPDFRAGTQVKIRKTAVLAVIALTACTYRRERLLRWFYTWSARGLPPAVRASGLLINQGKSTGTGGIQSFD